jgi:membrane protein YqaA with SNARE-associated domain
MIHSHIERLLHVLHAYVQKRWYPPLLGLLAAVDHFVIVIPTDGLLITAILAAPRRWLAFFAWLTLGSVAGGALLAGLIQVYGTPLLEWISPGIHLTSYWQLTDGWIERFGLWVLFVVAALPVFQHPAIAITALAELPLSQMTLAMLAGRLVKYGAFSWLASHAPRLLFKFKSIRKEVHEVEVAAADVPEPQPAPRSAKTL